MTEERIRIEKEKLDTFLDRTYTNIDAFAYLIEFVCLLFVLESSLTILFSGISILHTFLFLFGLCGIKFGKYLVNHAAQMKQTFKVISDANDKIMKLNKEVNNDKSNKD
jgi:hypothetical protein